MISALILAAGQSRRMRKPKLVLPWGGSTIIGKVIGTLKEAGLANLYIIVGGDSELVEQAVADYEIELIFNPDFAEGEMLSSIQVGLKHLPHRCDSALIVLGDQPQMEADVVRAIITCYHSTHKKMIIPSYEMHRGHPWLIDRSLWEEVLELRSPMTMRDYLKLKSGEIEYIPVSTPSVIQDLDTPSDYLKFRP